MADGGDGTIAVVGHYLNGTTRSIQVQDPLFRPIEASYLLSEDATVAFIEMAEASGHHLLKTEELNCLKTSTIGTGQLLKDAIAQGAKTIYLGIGGSATNDGGIGVAQALGYQFLDKAGNELSPIGEHLTKIETIKPPKKNILEGITIKVACDVTNPFYGQNGAAFVYAKQKGANKEAIEVLDKGLQNLAEGIADVFQIDVQQLKGSGAAGGLGGGAIAFLGAELVSGIDLIKELADFEENIKGATWLLTGEGNLDSQTLSGKTIGGVVTSASAQNIPVAAFCGGVSLSLEDQQALGLTYVTSIVKGISNLTEAVAETETNLRFAVANFLKVLKG